MSAIDEAPKETPMRDGVLREVPDLSLDRRTRELLDACAGGGEKGTGVVYGFEALYDSMLALLTELAVSRRNEALRAQERDDCKLRFDRADRWWQDELDGMTKRAEALTQERIDVGLDRDRLRGELAAVTAEKKLIRCDFSDACPGHASPNDRPCGYEPIDVPNVGGDRLEGEEQVRRVKRVRALAQRLGKESAQFYSTPGEGSVVDWLLDEIRDLEDCFSKSQSQVEEALDLIETQRLSKEALATKIAELEAGVRAAQARAIRWAATCLGNAVPMNALADRVERGEVTIP